MQALRGIRPLLVNLSKTLHKDQSIWLRCSVFMSTSVKPSVDTKWLKSEIEKNSKNLLVLDATWNRFVNGHELYLDSHIPGAQHFDLNSCTKPTRLIPRALPEPELFQQYLRSLGVSPDSHVIVYDRDDFDKVTTASAPRTWWTFRLHGFRNISVLNGGLLQWIKDGYPTKTGEEPKPTEGNFGIKKDTSLLRTFEEMQKIVDEGATQIVDTRKEPNFKGELPEPSEITNNTIKDRTLPVLKEGEIIGGHMKNAKNIPFIKLFQPQSAEQLTKDEYEKLFREVGIDLGKPLIATCYIGHTACIFALAAAVCGKDDVAVYSGSWTEWGQRMAKQA